MQKGQSYLWALESHQLQMQAGLRWDHYAWRCPSEWRIGAGRTSLITGRVLGDFPEGVLRIPRLMHLNDVDVILRVIFCGFLIGIVRIFAGNNQRYQPDQSSWSYFTLLPRDFSTGYFCAVTASFSNTI